MKTLDDSIRLKMIITIKYYINYLLFNTNYTYAVPPPGEVTYLHGRASHAHAVTPEAGSDSGEEAPCLSRFNTWG